jgi:hypothetical protein
VGDLRDYLKEYGRTVVRLKPIDYFAAFIMAAVLVGGLKIFGVM